jgi:membrane-bound lytic murein transglycosylase MltF
LKFNNDIASPWLQRLAILRSHHLRYLVLPVVFFFKSYILFLIVCFLLLARGSGLAQDSSGGMNPKAMHDEFEEPNLSIKPSLVTTPIEPRQVTDDNISDSLVSSVSDIYCRLRTSTNKSAIEELLSNLSRFSETYTDDLPDLLQRKTIRVLITSSPTNFFVSDGRIYGFEYSMLKEFENFLNRNTRRQDLKTVIEFIPVPEDILAPSLNEGLGDIAAAGLIVSGGSHQRLSYTDPYLTGVTEVFVSHRGIHPIQNLHDIAGKQIYLRRIKSYYESITRLNEQLNSAGLDPVRIVKADDYVTSEDILEMLNAGIIELTIIESHLAELWSDVLPNLMIHEGFPLRTNVNLAWMVRKNNPLLRDRLNQYVKDHKKGTLLGNIYFNRYFKDTKWITNPLDTGVRERSFRYAPLFKKYGEEYNIDWMLLSAVGYQESLLDHDRRSPKGAVGIMQVLPSTAMDPKINITDYHQIEDNIHAGAKYLAHLRDSYFNGAEMEPIDRLRFSLAAYNAGPSNVRRAQAMAAEMGYDPNRWFLHGEIGALKVIGQETVRYVSNINKFYLAYTLSDTLDCLKERKAENNKKKNTTLDSTRKREVRWVNKH